jgi:hypothetical protein
LSRPAIGRFLRGVDANAPNEYRRVVAADGLDAEKLQILDQWATGLQHDERPEVVAAARAILMLVQEVERLHIALWEQHLASEQQHGGEAPPDAPDPFRGEPPPLEESLLRRLRRRWAESPSSG